MIDLGSLATLLVAIAAVATAFVSYMTVRQNKRQVEMLIRQTMVLRSQQDPIPLIRSFSFEKNTFKITVENMGSGPASSLAIGTSYVPSKRTFYSDSQSSDRLSASEAKQAIEAKRQIYDQYELETDIDLIHDGKKVYPTDVACELVNVERDTTLLFPHEVHTYNIPLKFGFGSTKSQSTAFTDFDHIIDFLKQNGIGCVAVDLDLIGKNMTEDPIQSQRIATFVIDFDKRNNLEDAYKEKRRPFFLPLDKIEMAKEIPWDRETYLLSKSMVNYPKYFEEGKW